MRRFLAFAVLAAVAPLVAPATSVSAQEPPAIGANAVHLVVDTSGSMADADPTGRIKMEGAKSALLQFLDGAQLGTAVGLRTYPDPTAGSCTPGRLRFDIDRHELTDVSAVIRGLQPDGDTPTSEALDAAAADIRRSGFPSATLVLVSDGESTCDDPCETASEIVASGLNVEVITVGFQISNSGAEELQCIASVTGGRYIDIDDSDQLEQVLRDVSVPRMTLEVSHPDEVVAEVGFGSTGVVSVTARVSNDGQAQASNVRVWIQFETDAPGVIAPVRSLGNIAPGASSNPMTWFFRPGLLLAGTDVEFSVIVRAANVPTDIGQDGSIAVLDRVNRSEAGAILRNSRMAIMGDSYSAGEGADDYLSPTDSAENACHRSRLTYAADVFGIDPDAILACSGAITHHIQYEDEGNGVPPQLDQLRAAQTAGTPFEAVLMTLGGNDAKFSTIAKTCFFGTCNDEIDGQPSEQFIDDVLDGMATSLTTAYGAIHATLNSPEVVRRRGGVAPIIVLAYPRPVPTVHRACWGILAAEFAGFEGLFSTDELTFVQRFITELNGRIEGAVEAARMLDERVPVFYVPNPEESFLPDHTMCDPEPYARGVDSFNGAAFDVDVELTDLIRQLNPFQTYTARIAHLVEVLGRDVFKRSAQELMHPNEGGYDAMTRALIRWSNGPEADEIEQFLRTVPTPPENPTCTDIGDPVVLTELSQAELLNVCVPYQLSVSSFAPYSDVEVEVRSTPRTLGVFEADADGTVQGEFVLPIDLSPGQHTLRVVGAADGGGLRELTWSFELEREHDRPPLALAVGGVVFVLLGGGLFAGPRRRIGTGS